MNIGFRLFARHTSRGWVWGEDVMVEGLARRIQRLTGNYVWVGDRKSLARNVDVVISLAPQYDGVPVTPTARNILWQQFPGSLRGGKSFPVEGLCDRYDFVFCGSKRLYELVKSPRKSEVLYVTADEQLALGQRSSSVAQIVFVGNYHANLRSDSRLKAFLEPVADLGLEIYGSGWERAPEQLRHRWLGPIESRLVPGIYRAASLVMSIHGDKHIALQMPNTRIMEAAACGACVVSDRFGELESLFGDAVVWTEGYESLRMSAIDLLGDPKRRRELGAAAQSRLLEQCSMESTARRIVERSSKVLEGVASSGK